MAAKKFGSAKQIQNFQKDCSRQPKCKSIFSMLTKVVSTVLFCLTPVRSLF